MYIVKVRSLYVEHWDDLSITLTVNQKDARKFDQSNDQHVIVNPLIVKAGGRFVKLVPKRHDGCQF